MATRKKPTGHIIYQGPSLIDGQPIFVVALSGSKNTKTGSMVQTYIMRSDIDPRDASKTGADFSICGGCPHRGHATSDPAKKQATERTCYVLLGQGPRLVFQGFKAGAYPVSDDLENLGSGRMIRLGSYGDPAAVPSHIWSRLLDQAEGHTAYSHQSDQTGADFRSDMFMASADKLSDAMAYWSANIRTFRVISNVNETQPNEILCPASEEAGRLTKCHACGLCGGSDVHAKSIAIVAHGAGKNHFTQKVQQSINA